MYAHQVVESLRRFQKDQTIGKIFPEGTFDFFIKEIFNAQKFYMEETRDDKLMDVKGIGFSGKNAEVKLPYKTIWIDFYRRPDTPEEDAVFKKKNIVRRSDGEILVTKRSLLAKELREDIISVFIFNEFDKKVFHPPLHVHYIVLTKDPNYDLEVRKRLADLKKTEKGILSSVLECSKGNVVSVPIAKKELLLKIPDYNVFLNEQKQQDFDELTQLNVFLKLLSCKNISTIENHPPHKLNKKRAKNSKLPLFTYKTLTIKPIGKKHASQAPQDLWKNRVHLCRGHFKTYTKEKPLLGKFTGCYWWQPSVRGNKKKGVVMKDYQVETA